MSKSPSILNDVLGPVMRGPSSSHTAGSYHIGRLLRSLLADEPAAARFYFDADGSYAQVYRQQGSDLGFAAGLLGWEITDERFPQALGVAATQQVAISFSVVTLPEVDHPNLVRIEAVRRDGRPLELLAKSVGGGAVVISRLQGWPVQLAGKAYELLLVVNPAERDSVEPMLSAEPQAQLQRGDRRLLHYRRPVPFAPNLLEQLSRLPAVVETWTAEPIFYPIRAEQPFASAADGVKWAHEQGKSLGEMALAYESSLLNLPESAVMDELLRRYQVMASSVQQGLREEPLQLQLLSASAGRIFQAEAAGKLAVGGLHSRAAARAMAVMHVNGGRGVVCAAPTAGAAGTLPAVLVTLAEELKLNEEQVVMAMLAAGGVGLLVAERATFAAEVAGCQVEIGAAGAMAAAAVVEAAGGAAGLAADAAAIAFQNTMGSVCDLVQGVVEIPCHTRNAVAASSAFVCADLVLGGYFNPIPLHETIDAVLAVGKLLPRELRCTALGGLAQTPSALTIPRARYQSLI